MGLALDLVTQDFQTEERTMAGLPNSNPSCLREDGLQCQVLNPWSLTKDRVLSSTLLKLQQRLAAKAWC